MSFPDRQKKNDLFVLADTYLKDQLRDKMCLNVGLYETKYCKQNI